MGWISIKWILRMKLEYLESISIEETSIFVILEMLCLILNKAKVVVRCGGTRNN
jgi:hypothetical protein